MDNVPHNNTEAPQTPHSGDLGLEQPEIVFDHTTLPEAFDKYLTDTDGNVIVPNNAASVTSEKETSAEAPQSHRRRNVFVAIGAGVLATVAAASLAIGLNLPKGDHDNNVLTPNDKATNQPTTGPTSSPEAKPTTPPEAGTQNDPEITDANSAEILSSLKFTPEMTPEQIGQKYSEILSRWAMAGATKEMWYNWLNADAPDDEAYAQEIAQKNAKVYAVAIFGENYEATADSTILSFVDNATKYNASNITAYIRSYGDEKYPNQNTKNKVAWNTSVENLANTVESQTGSSITLVVRQKLIDNGPENMWGGTEIDSKNGLISDTTLVIDKSQSAPRATSVSTQDIN